MILVNTGGSIKISKMPAKQQGVIPRGTDHRWAEACHHTGADDVQKLRKSPGLADLTKLQMIGVSY